MSEAVHPKMVNVNIVPDENIIDKNAVGVTPYIRLPVMLRNMTKECLRDLITTVKGIWFLTEGKERRNAY